MAAMWLRGVRLGDAAALARVHAEAWQTAYSAILPPKVVEGFSLRNRQALWEGLLGHREPPLVQVAETNDQGLVGFAWFRLVRLAGADFDSEIIAIAVTPALQRCGLGRQLMAAAAGRLAALGAGSCYLWVYRDNLAARGFYEKLAGRKIDDDVEVYEDLEIPIVAYGWKPLTALTEAAARSAGRTP